MNSLRAIPVLAALAMVALPAPAFAAAPDSGSCSLSQGVKVEPLPVEKVDTTAVTADRLTDADIRAGLTAAGAKPSAVKVLLPRVRDIAARESGGNPNAVNVNDASPANDRPTGVLQLRPSKFATAHVAGTSTQVKDKVANVAAWITIASMDRCVDLGTGTGIERL